MYITAYMTNPNQGVSKVTHEMKKLAEADPSNKTVEQLRKIGSAHVRSHEIGIQEACRLLIRQQLIDTTRTVLFINTNLPDKRNYTLKPMATIEAMFDDQTDFSFKNQQLRFCCRPISLKSMRLADFMSQYRMQYFSKLFKQDNRNPLVCGDSDSDKEDEVSEEQVKPSDGSFVVKIKDAQHYRLIRYVCVGILKDRKLYFREQLILYYPFYEPDESDILGSYNSFKEKFNHVREVVEKHRLFYDPFKDQFDEASEEFKNVGNSKFF